MENKYIEYNRKQHGEFTFDNEAYVLLQHAYEDTYMDRFGVSNFFAASAIRPSDIVAGAEDIPVYQLRWDIPDDADPQEPEEYINWEVVSDASETDSVFCLEDGIVF